MTVRNHTVNLEPDSHLALCLTIERVFLAVRSLAYFIIVPLFAFGYLPGTLSDVIVITAIVVLHNAFAHWVLWSGRHQFFFSWFNFAIYFVEASLGTEVKVPTLDGEHKLKIPPGSQTGTVFRLKGKGFPHLNRRGSADQLVTLFVATPESLSEKQRQLLRELGNSFNPDNMPQPEKRKENFK